MNLRTKILMVLAIALSITAAVGCSNKMSFEGDTNKGAGALGNGDGSSDDLPGQSDPGTQAVADTCEAAHAAGRLQQLTTPL
jgi:hypothetical protein